MAGSHQGTESIANFVSSAASRLAVLVERLVLRQVQHRGGEVRAGLQHLRVGHAEQQHLGQTNQDTNSKEIQTPEM